MFIKDCKTKIGAADLLIISFHLCYFKMKGNVFVSVPESNMMTLAF